MKQQYYEEVLSMPFLDPSWYQSFWSYVSFWCPELTSSTVAAVASTDSISVDSLAPSKEVSGTVDPLKNDTSVENTTAEVENSSPPTSQGDKADTATPTEVTTDDAPENRCPGDDEEESTAESPSSVFRLSFQTVTTFFVIFAINAMLQGNDIVSLIGLGKVAVAAVAVSAAFSKSSTKQYSIKTNPRQLQICNFNVDILLDGCFYTFDVKAPSARIVDAVLENLTSADSPNKMCTTDYSAVLTFPVSDNNTELQPNTTVSSFLCDMIAEGRPFVDETGKRLQASPIVQDDDSSWSGYLSKEVFTRVTTFSNETDSNLSLLAEEWTRRALAEHASVASFAAHSIALMTNQAPSILVEDALKAGLDEVRHAKVSFDIASMLAGKEVGPGPLPTSNVEFEQDLITLALAVAKEGCIDETLSTFTTALEANAIHEVIQSGAAGTKYSNVNLSTLSLMRDELRKIAIEESSHSALAWRTIKWVCSVDSYACKTVGDAVFGEKLMRQKIGRVDLDNYEVLEMIQKAWDKIFVVHNSRSAVAYEQPACNNVNEVDAEVNGIPFINQLMANIQSGVLCRHPLF
jgi:hypothetical protein